VAAAALVAVPMWTGHAMFNLKDTPVAVGNTVMSAGLVAVAFAAGKAVGRREWLMRLAGCGAMVPGIVLMVGTRPGMWSAVAVVLAQAHLYRLRQLLFAVPAEAVLATLGIASASAWAATRGPATRICVGVVGAAALVLPTMVQARLFPYQYSYTNVAAELAG